MDKYLNFIRLSINDLLRQRDWNQSDLAKAMGVSRQNLNKLMTVDRLPTVSTVKAVADALNIELFYLLMSPEDRKKWDAMKSGKCDDSSVYLEAIKNLNSRIKDLEEKIKDTPKKTVERLHDPNKR